jgi:hypothetical protein
LRHLFPCRINLRPLQFCHSDPQGARAWIPPPIPSSVPNWPAVGLCWVDRISWNAPAPVLYQEAVARGEGIVAEGGALVVTTGQHTGRSPNDKFVVRDETTENTIWWDNNKAMSREPSKP